MTTFHEFLNNTNENVLFTGYSKDGRIFMNIDGERKTVVVDALYHNKIKQMEKRSSEDAFNFILKLIESGDAFIL
jgi:hypothetical protein